MAQLRISLENTGNTLVAFERIEQDVSVVHKRIQELDFTRFVAQINRLVQAHLIQGRPLNTTALFLSQHLVDRLAGLRFPERLVRQIHVEDGLKTVL